ncbi:uncharacterized protein AB9W97_012104 isoform 1-T2 [Spinachia spinachia]
MEAIFATLCCYLLASPFAVAQKQEEPTVPPAITTPDFNSTLTSTPTSPTKSTGQVTDTSNSATFSSSTRDGATFAPTTAATPESIAAPRTSNSTSTTATPPAPPTSSMQTAVLHGLRLNISEKSMTVAFSSVLGVLGLAVVVFMFHKCKHKIQYLHQPLNSTGDTDDFVADDDTLVISGGLYDGHPIYDNVPPVPADQSQFPLHFRQ